MFLSLIKLTSQALKIQNGFYECMLELAGSFSQADKDEKPVQWFPPIIMTVATEGNGIEALIEAIQKHENYLCQSGKWISHERFTVKIRIGYVIERYASIPLAGKCCRTSV
jgi:putative protein kinase ArgK-like GTPase of G3E family